MPAKPALESRATAVLGTPRSRDYITAKGIVASATSLTDAVTRDDFFLGPVEDRYKTEIVNMLDQLAQLAPKVARGVLDALEDALQRNARVVFVWNELPEGDFDYSYSRGVDHVAHLELRTPRGNAAD